MSTRRKCIRVYNGECLLTSRPKAGSCDELSEGFIFLCIKAGGSESQYQLEFYSSADLDVSRSDAFKLGSGPGIDDSGQKRLLHWVENVLQERNSLSRSITDS